MRAFLMRLLKKDTNDIFEHLPEGVCPNCWKDQQYGNIIKERAKIAKVCSRDQEANYIFIQGYLVRHLDFLKLKNTFNGLECTTCKTIIKKDTDATY